jgi:hypothetical protein
MRLLASLPPLAVAAIACGGPRFEVGAAAGDAGSSFCARDAGAHTFCDDFDGLPFSSVWDATVDVNGAVATDSSTSISPPNSFVSTANPSLGSTGQGRLTKTLGKASRVVVAVDVRLDEVPDRPGSALGGGTSLLVVDVGPTYVVGLSANSQQVSYFENDTVDGGLVTLGSRNLVPTQSLLGNWAHVVFDVELASAKLTVSINGTTELGGASITPPTGLSTSVVLGEFSRNVATEAKVHYDDVTIDVTP